MTTSTVNHVLLVKIMPPAVCLWPGAIAILNGKSGSLGYFPPSTHAHALETYSMVLQAFFQDLLATSDQSTLAKFGLLAAVPVVAWWLYAALTSGKKPHGTRKIHRLPGTLPLLGDTVELLANVTRFHDWAFEICRQSNGEPVRVSALGRPELVMMCSPEAFEECLKLQFDNFPKGPFQCQNLRAVLGDGIFAADHAKWVHQRKTASNLFTARTIRDGMAETVCKHTTTLCAMFQRAAKSGETVDLFKLFNRLTIEAFAEIGFGIEMHCLDAKEEHPFQTAFDSAQRVLALRFLRPSWFWKTQRFLGVGAEGQLTKDVKVIDDTVLDIIGKSLLRRQRGEVVRDEKNDVVSLFLDNFENSADSKDREFDPTYLRDIVVNFLIAGRDTTAQALSWFFYNISTNPHVVQKIRDEIARELPGLLDGSIATPSMEQVQGMTYLDAALKETLRLHPSVPFTTKHVAEDIVLSDGIFIAKNSNIGLSSYGLGRMTNVWGPDAAAFNPDRWIDPKTGKILSFPAHKFVAFNAGPRLCLGMNLAMMEMKIVVATVLSQLDVEVLPNQNVTYDFSLTLPVHGELLARVKAIEVA